MEEPQQNPYESDSFSSNTSDLYTLLARTDPLIAMRLNNQNRWDLLRGLYPVVTEESEKYSKELQKNMFRELTDFVLNGELSNVNALAIRQRHSKLLSEREKNADRIYSVNAKLGETGDMLLTAQFYWDRISPDYADRSLPILLWLSALTAYKPIPGTCANGLLTQRGAGISLMGRTLFDYVFIPGTVNWITLSSSKVMDEREDMSGTINFFSEGSAFWLEKDPAMKMAVTTGCTLIQGLVRPVTGPFCALQTCHNTTCANFVFTRRPSDELTDAALRSRFFTAQIADKNGAHLKGCVYAHPTGENIEGWKEPARFYFQTMQVLYYFAECAIKAAVIDDVDTSVLAARIPEFEKECLLAHVEFGPRDVERLELLTRTVTILAALHARFLAPPNRFCDAAWKIGDLLLAAPFKTTEEAVNATFHLYASRNT